MNRLLLLLLFCTAFALPSFSASAPAPAATMVTAPEVIIQPKPLFKKGGLKARLAKKWIMKKLRMAEGEPTQRQKKWGRLALIFGVGSLVLLLIPYVGLLAVPSAIAGLVLGIKSLKGNSNASGLIGVIASGVTILLFLIALVYIASFGWL